MTPTWGEHKGVPHVLVRHQQKGLIYFAENAFEERVHTKGFGARASLADAENLQLDKRLKPEIARGYKAYSSMAAQLQNRITNCTSEQQVYYLRWDNTGLEYEDADQSLAAAQLYAHLIGAEHVENVLKAGSAFSELETRYRVEFEEALLNEATIKALLNKIPLTREEFNALEEAYRNQAFVVSRVSSSLMLRQVQENLAAHLRQGADYASWKKNLDETFVALGMAPPSDYYAENVFRTNVMSAYNSGRWEQFQRNASHVAMLEYHNPKDARSRPNHAAMDGTKAPLQSPLWNTWYPPNGYRCRCWVIAITPYAAQRWGIQPDATFPAVSPDAGFENNPAAGLPPAFLARAQEFGIPLQR